MRYRFSGLVHSVTGDDAFSLEVDPSAQIVYDTTGIPSRLDIRIAPDSPLQSAALLKDAMVTCFVADTSKRPLLARVHRCSRSFGTG